MSRIAKKPVPVPKGVEFKLDNGQISVKGPKGNLEMKLHPDVDAREENGEIVMVPASSAAVAMAGTMRSLIANMFQGVAEGFERKLQLVGVGYRAQVQGSNLNLTLGFSHPISYTPPEGVTLEAPSNTEVIVRGVDKQKVGQAAAEIRAYRPPEPYKGKGVRYADEQIIRKEAKKA